MLAMYTKKEMPLEDVERLVKEMNRKIRPGMYAITTKIWKDGESKVVKNLHQVISAGWKTEKVPQDWEQAVIILLHMMEKTRGMENARSTSLLSVLDTQYSLEQF